ncbi:hypothetical protein WOC76_11930 [Methylocystis sp. IM3]|uniref:hypothetical protein n=1 Tax=unclassified Methylocystis TaxID=2625913 RepID=UPI000FA6A5B1|nr:MAG: hypothetical protein EKK29_04235 [Hyphomicrobiales bacterium]
MARTPATGATPSQASTPARRAEEDAAAMASYIADMTAELAQLAARAELQMVAYFLNLARVEAEIRAREMGGAVILREN